MELRSHDNKASIGLVRFFSIATYCIVASTVARIVNRTQPLYLKSDYSVPASLLAGDRTNTCRFDTQGVLY